MSMCVHVCVCTCVRVRDGEGVGTCLIFWTVTLRLALWDDGHPLNGLRDPRARGFPGGLGTHCGQEVKDRGESSGLWLQAELGQHRALSPQLTQPPSLGAGGRLQQPLSAAVSAVGPGSCATAAVLPPGSVRDPRGPVAFPQASTDLRPEKGTEPGSPGKDSAMPTRHAKVRAEDRPRSDVQGAVGASRVLQGTAVPWVVLALGPPGPGPSARAGSWREGCGRGTQRGTCTSRCWRGCRAGVSCGGVSRSLTMCSPCAGVSRCPVPAVPAVLTLHLCGCGHLRRPGGWLFTCPYPMGQWWDVPASPSLWCSLPEQPRARLLGGEGYLETKPGCWARVPVRRGRRLWGWRGDRTSAQGGVGPRASRVLQACQQPFPGACDPVSAVRHRLHLPPRLYLELGFEDSQPVTCFPVGAALWGCCPVGAAGHAGWWCVYVHVCVHTLNMWVQSQMGPCRPRFRVLLCPVRTLTEGLFFGQSCHQLDVCGSVYFTCF